VKKSGTMRRIASHASRSNFKKLAIFSFEIDISTNPNIRWAGKRAYTCRPELNALMQGVILRRLADAMRDAKLDLYAESWVCFSVYRIQLSVGRVFSPSGFL